MEKGEESNKYECAWVTLTVFSILWNILLIEKEKKIIKIPVPVKQLFFFQASCLDF